MAGIPKEHTELYFDKLCRTQKLETVFALIEATYYCKKNPTTKPIRDDIAERLVNAFDLFRNPPKGQTTGSGTYSGDMKQFESQYTIGHELCIWKNKSLDLNPKAIDVAEHRMTIRQYFDIFFYNYFQPIDGKSVHMLYGIMNYMLSNGTNTIEKQNIKGALGVDAENENINALCNFMGGTSYLKYDDDSLTYIGKEPVASFIKHCNTKYLGVSGLQLARMELDTDDKYAEYIMSLNEEEKILVEEIDYDTCERLKTGTNIILYGVPGAGKSWTIKNEYCNDDNRMERLVFHPDYTYSDFVGQILPKPDGNGGINYEFTPGPFTTLVKKAYLNPMQEFFLVIEEVNRGNAPAIFGDIFQLLDRTSEGGSAYKITNADIARIVYGDESHKLSIPSNMSILCTMNTSDQNVFTLDTAFQRRWSMRLIKNKFTDDPKETAFANTPILDTSVTWETFFTKINNIILSKNIRMTSSEDKRLGTHFVSIEDLKYVDVSQITDKKELLSAERQNKKFAEKVLKYLWDDAFKFNKDEIFDLSKVNSLEKVIDEFAGTTGDARFKAIFKDNISSTLLPKPKSEE